MCWSDFQVLPPPKFGVECAALDDVQWLRMLFAFEAATYFYVRL
jgi:hypothetical protein